MKNLKLNLYDIQSKSQEEESQAMEFKKNKKFCKELFKYI